MSKRDFKITDASRGAALTIKIVPKANRTELVGLEEDGTIKVRLMAPPVEGQANDELTIFLAEFLGVPQDSIEVVAGLDRRKKLVSVLNVEAEEVERRVHEAVGYQD